MISGDVLGFAGLVSVYLCYGFCLMTFVAIFGGLSMLTPAPLLPP
jgi:hypothetical protein